MSQEEEGIRVVLSAPQLAAVLTQESISESATLSNRLWGGLRVAGGVVELVGAGVLCVAPEPTMASKVGCVVFGVHGSDTTATGLRQVWTGRDAQSLTHMSTAALARSLGASENAANNIGLAVDIAVPFAMSGMVAAARVASIRAGRINLLLHEAQQGSRVGGHTILKHVGKTEAELRARLAAQRGITGASSFSTLDVAERVISSGLRANAARIQAWASQASAAGGAANLKLVHSASSVIGHGVMRATNVLQPMTRLQIILKFEVYNGNPYYILTAFPIP
jgi:hypothetical protein